MNWHQKPHKRRSKRGKIFLAGRGQSKPQVTSRKRFYHKRYFSTAKTVLKSAFPEYSPVIEAGYQLYLHRKEASEALKLLNNGQTNEAFDLAISSTQKVGVEMTSNTIAGAMAEYSAGKLLGQESPYKQQYVQLMKREISTRLNNEITNFLEKQI